MSFASYFVAGAMILGGLAWLLANWLGSRVAKKWEGVAAVALIMFGALKLYFRF